MTRKPFISDKKYRTHILVKNPDILQRLITKDNFEIKENARRGIHRVNGVNLYHPSQAWFNMRNKLAQKKEKLIKNSHLK